MNIETTHYLTESDVEQKFIFPFAIDALLFNPEEIKTKDYLTPTDIDKGAGKKLGYYPDYAIYLLGLPILVIEAKDPKTNSEVGFREASLYAHEINKRFPTNLNPVLFILSTKEGLHNSRRSVSWMLIIYTMTPAVRFHRFPGHIAPCLLPFRPLAGVCPHCRRTHPSAP